MPVIRLRALLPGAILLAAVTLLAQPASSAEKLRVLIVDGQNNHNWRAMTPPMKAALEQTGRFTVDVATTPTDKNAPPADWDAFRPEFGKYDVVLSNYNGQPWPEEVNRSLEKYVAGGGGLVIIHAANNAFEGWPEWNKMIGLGWRGGNFGDRITVDDRGEVVRTPKGQGPGAGHGRQHPFAIVVRDATHPVMQGMPREWMHAQDELYHGQRGPAADMHLLATAYSAKETGGTDAHEPMIWWIPYGKGKVFTTVMGHVGGEKDPSIRCVGFQTVMCRGCEWAATGKVTLPIPENFPTATEVRLAQPASP
jgi:type 1 glutamine amidotransferase